jgi:PKD repeat protein
VSISTATYSVNEGSPITLVASGSDADAGDQLSFAWDLNGDGVYETLGNPVTFTPPNGPLTLNPKVRVTDSGGLMAQAGTSVIVTNVAPVVSDTIVWNGDSTIVEPVAKARTPYTAGVSFTDAGLNDKHTVTFTWGDGSSPLPADVVVTEANGTGSAVGTHTYAQPGFYAVTATVSDGADTITKTAKQSIVVVDPLGKYETGSGSFASPAGSFVSNPTMVGLGTVNSLTAKYGPDGTLGYIGNTNGFKFTYATGGLSFTGTKMSWLVVNGNKSWLKGEGTATVGGVAQPAEYLLSAVDATASPSADKIRVRILNKSTGKVLYDTQKSAVDTADATTPTPSYITVVFK